MNQKENHDKLERTPRVRYIGFSCPSCNSGWMIWHNRKESGIQTHVYEFFIIEGNPYPEIAGSYVAKPESQEQENDVEIGTWTCEECGYALTDLQGVPLRSIADVIKYLTIKYDDVGLDLHLLDPALSLEDIDNIAFDRKSALKEELKCRRKDLYCPSCGHGEFIEEKQWLIQTPVRVEKGMLHWCIEERLWQDMDRPGHGRYYCSKCGFVLPDPLCE